MKRENLQKIIALRHRLHMHPERSMQEKETVAILQQFLRENTTLRIVDRGKWFYALKEGTTPSERIAFRADMDALPITENELLPYHSQNPGVSHKCGHDGHSAILCGLALELESIETAATIYLIFQPGEETGEGGKICSELIREEAIREVFAIHNLGGYPENSVVYRRGLTQPASEGLKLHFAGKMSHASAPEEGNNPASVIADVIRYADEILQQNTSGMALCTVTGIRLGSGDFGISPGEGELYFTLRAEHEIRMKELEARILDYARGRCEERGIRLESSVHDFFPETRNHDNSLQHVLDAASDQKLKIIEMDRIWRASEDFGWYLKACPGAIVYIGNGEDYPALHTEEYDFNDRILETAVDLFASISRRHETHRS